MESKLYKKIMVAIDGSENANKAAISGIEVARLSGAKLYAVTVMPTIPHLSYFGVSIEPTENVSPDEKDYHKHLVEDGRKTLEIVNEIGVKAGVQMEKVLLEGHPGSEIIKFAEKNDIDLIVMGTLGRTGLDRVILGSVALDVARHARTRIMIVK